MNLANRVITPRAVNKFLVSDVALQKIRDAFPEAMKAMAAKKPKEQQVNSPSVARILSLCLELFPFIKKTSQSLEF